MSNALLSAVDTELDQSVERWRDFLSIPSIGTDPAYDADTRRAASWLVEQLTELGFDVSLRETPGQPMVVGHYKPANVSGPHLLYYGHYDVQPVDPLELWDTPPFEPTLQDGPNGKRMVARGAVDDKGQVMTWLEAFRAYRAVHGELPCQITVFIEGEEEGGGTNLEPFMIANQDELKADICVISDTGMLGPDSPAITTMLRGIVYCEVALHGPSQDLHSGMFGGAVVNPINALTKLLANLHDDDNRVTLPGFYDQVTELSDEQRTQWDNADFDQADFLQTAGFEQSFGEAGRSVLERIWSRPTLDINGIWGGYQGDGQKTVIAASAHAKLSCRVVPDQQGQDIAASLEQYFADHCPPGCRIDFTKLGVGSPIRVPTTSTFIEAASRAATTVFGKEPALIGCGGSIPVAASMQSVLGMDTLLLGFGLADDQVHSPNEKFDLICLERGIKTHCLFLADLAAQA